MRKRLDLLLVERGLCDSRTRAQALVLEGKVRVAGQVETKASRQVEEDAEVELEAPPRFVSRGGEKMQGAFDKFAGLSAEGRVCIDVGSSTGGFTDCLLQHGAAFVMAVDVGTNQLAYKLRSDPRVWVHENYNARYMKPEDLPQVPTLAVTDVSFISLKLILPPMAEVLLPGGEIVSLIKPQFEAGREKVGKKGVVRDEKVHLEVVQSFVEFFPTAGFTLMGLDFSPIRGPEGNIEYLAWLRCGAQEAPAIDPAAVVAASHTAFKEKTE